jgi:putative endonuclease
MTLPIQLLIRVLQKIRRGSRRAGPEHLALGQSGESEAYFFLKRQGYRMVASNFRIAKDHGEIDFIGWDDDVLCFVEVKTRSDDSFAPPSTAVTDSKRRHILSVAKRYLRRMPGRPPCRFDILSIIPREDEELRFSLQKGAFTWESRRERSYGYRDWLSHQLRR